MGTERERERKRRGMTKMSCDEIKTTTKEQKINLKKLRIDYAYFSPRGGKKPSTNTW